MTQQNILVVDDEAPMRVILSFNLKASGYAVRLAADGWEALRLLEQHSFDLLVLDINIPGPNGLQVLQTVRRSLDTPVLVVSGLCREADRDEAFFLGADDFLSKPFAISELLARVESVLRRAEFRQPLRTGSVATEPTPADADTTRDASPTAPSSWRLGAQVRPKL